MGLHSGDNRRGSNGAGKVLEVRYLEAQDAFELAEREAQSILGVSAEEAFEMLDRGKLDGTAAKAEMSMLRSLMAA